MRGFLLLKFWGIEPQNEAVKKMPQWGIFRLRALRVYRAMQQDFTQ